MSNYHDFRNEEFKGEVLQASSLEDFDWPEFDPHTIPQRTRIRTDKDIELVRTCLDYSKINMKAFLKNARKDQLTQQQIVLSLLAHRKFQMNPVKEVKQEERWNEAVQKAISQNVPIDIIYPQFCVIPNAPKQYTNTLPAAGEDCTIEFFKLINQHVQHVYKPGVKFHALADASLYASAFHTHQAEVDMYYNGLQERVKALDATDCVEIHDYSELLRTKCHPAYLELYYYFGNQVWPGNLQDLLPNTDMPTLRRSVRCSVNTRRFQLTHNEHRQLFGPMDERATEHQYYSLIENLTDIALREVITIRLACNAIDISSRLWPDAVRATCHKGEKNGRWAIGLRPYPEYYGSCKLLPYHGMPLITRNSQGKPKLIIEPEVLLRSRDDLVRVTISDDRDDVYAYISIDIDEEIIPNIKYKRHLGMRRSEFEKKENGNEK